MRDFFASYYSPTEEAFAQLWENAVFILDANVLLNLYRYPAAARDELLKLFERFSGRIWIPYQAALEYQRSRLSVIASQRSRFDEVRKILREAETKIQTDLGKLQLKKRHSTIDPDQLLDEISSAINKFSGQLEELEKSQPDVFEEDPIRTQLDRILTDRICPAFTQEQINAVCADGKRRYEDCLPPGFKDEEKGAQSNPVITTDGIRIERKFGDLIIWKQIMHLALEKQFKSVIFVTDDEKPDWWWIVDSKGKKTIGPRPELIEEIKREAAVEHFYIYNSERFMESASRYLGVQVSKTTIDQVGDIRRLIEQAGAQKLGAAVDDAVYRWLTEQFPNDDVNRSEGFPDFTIERSDMVLGWEVKRLTPETLEKKKINFFSALETSKSSYGIDKLCFIIVAPSLGSAGKINEILKNWSIQQTHEITFLVGFIHFAQDLSKFKFALTSVHNMSDDFSPNISL
jgi:hypothetical protein